MTLELRKLLKKKLGVEDVRGLKYSNITSHFSKKAQKRHRQGKAILQDWLITPFHIGKSGTTLAISFSGYYKLKLLSGRK